MAENRISANLAPADRQAVMQAIATIKEKLPFLIDLTPEDRRTMLKMGDKSRAFVSKALEVTTQNPNFLPRSFDVEEMRRDLEVLLHHVYDSTLDEIHALLKRIDDLEDEEDLKAIKEAREDIRINGTVSWNEIQNEIKKNVA